MKRALSFGLSTNLLNVRCIDSLNHLLIKLLNNLKNLGSGQYQAERPYKAFFSSPDIFHFMRYIYSRLRNLAYVPIDLIYNLETGIKGDIFLNAVNVVYIITR